MTWWMVLAGWLLGWLLAVRPAMKRRMLQPACVECGDHWMCNCGDVSAVSNKRYNIPQRVVRGSKFDRAGVDVFMAIVRAASWPVWLAWAVATMVLVHLGRGVRFAVVRATPLTKPELERRLAEQQKEIDRLTAEIGGKS